MFPFCLINASVTDAEGIRSRLVSFPPTLFSSVYHVAFSNGLFKETNRISFPCFSFLLSRCCFYVVLSKLSCRPDYFFHFHKVTAGLLESDTLKCQTAQPGTFKQKTFPQGAIGFTSLLWHSLHSCFQAWLIISPLLTWLISLADHITAGYRKSCFLSAEAGNEMCCFWADSGACLATQR